MTVDQIFRPGGSGVENVLLQPPPRITWRLAIEREEAALGRHDDFISRSFSGLKELFERRPYSSLTPLESIVDSGVDHIAPKLDRSSDRLLVHPVRALIPMAEIGTQPDGRHAEPLLQAEMLGGRAGAEPCGISTSPFGSRPVWFAHSKPPLVARDCITGMMGDP